MGVKRNSSTQLDCQNLQLDSTSGSRLGSIRGLAARIKRFYSMQFDGQVDDVPFVSQARIEAVHRRCDSYNKMLIVSILIFNAIIIAFITFLFFFPFQKYEL